MELRSFLEKLRQNGQLLEIDKRVKLDFEFAAIEDAMEKESRPAGLFTNTDHPSGIPVIGGVLGTMKRIALALDCREPEINQKVDAALGNLIEPELVENPPFLENRITGDDINLREQLPIPYHNPGDAGPYITGGIIVSKDPETGRQNFSFNRLQVKGPRKLGLMMNEWRHIFQFFRKYEAKGENMPIAIAIGVDPAVEMSTGFRIDEDEAMLAGALNGAPLKVAAGSVGINVPADTEILVEGYVKVKEWEDEGPLAEFTGHYGEHRDMPVIEVTSISYRNDPIYQTIVPASNEHVNVGNVLSREPMLKRMVTHVSPNVTDVHLTPYTGGFMAVIALNKTNSGEPKNVALAALMTHVNIKIAVIVDPDVNIYMPSDILWAMSTRVDAKKDIITIPYAQGMENDPTTDEEGMQTKFAIDATIDLKIKDDYKRVTYPAVDLDAFLKQ